MAPLAPSLDTRAKRRSRAKLWPALGFGLLLIAATPSPPADAIAAARQSPPVATVTSDLSTFVAIHSASLGDYESCQLKLTYLGAQTKLRSSLAVVGTLRTGGFNLAAFTPFEHHGNYGNDSFVGDTLRVSAVELKAFVDALAAYPALQDTTPPPVPHVSLMVTREYGAATLCWEHITDSYAQGDTLFQLLHDALAGAADRATVDQFRHHLVGIRR